MCNGPNDVPPGAKSQRRLEFDGCNGFGHFRTNGFRGRVRASSRADERPSFFLLKLGTIPFISFSDKAFSQDSFPVSGALSSIAA